MMLTVARRFRWWRIVVRGLFEELQQGDCESGGAEPVGDQDAAEIFIEPQLEISDLVLEVGFGGEF